MTGDEQPDTAVGVGADETEFINNAPRNAATPLAWELAESDNDAEGNPSTGLVSGGGGRSWIWAGGIAAVAVSIGVATAMGIVVSNHRHSASTPAIGQPTKTAPPPRSEAAQPIPTSQPPAVVSAPALDGTYQLTNDHGPLMWYGFRSTCRPAGCTAAGTRLNDDNHFVAYGPDLDPGYSHLFLRWVNDHWEGGSGFTVQCSDGTEWNPNSTVPPPVGRETDSAVMSLKLDPDGIYRGTETITTVDSDPVCKTKSGQVWPIPIVATRTGPPPVGVVPDPPTG